jgi:hypothetical protein
MTWASRESRLYNTVMFLKFSGLIEEEHPKSTIPTLSLSEVVILFFMKLSVAFKIWSMELVESGLLRFYSNMDAPQSMRKITASF